MVRQSLWEFFVLWLTILCNSRKGNSKSSKRMRTTTQRQLGRDLNIPKSTIQNTINNFAECGHSNHKIGETTQLARTEDVVTYTEFCKQQQPSISAKEIWRKPVDNVCLGENCLSTSWVNITRALREDLRYSYNQLNVTVREWLTANTEQCLLEYLTACSKIDPTSMHFLVNALLSKQQATKGTVTHKLEH